ncbi:MAG: flagellar M-ring protein FliF, partial [Candidatus Methylomirabilis sp.]|nr:flagellar M-ring protein FliF [Deltaproteobacteria bacterium]
MDIFTQLGGAFGAMTPARRLGMLLSLAITVGGFYVLYQIAQRPNYGLLYGGMSTEDAGLIVDALKEERVPFRLGAGGTAVEVPEERVYETRLALASKGLPRGGGVGFEIFDKQSFGMTDFVQRLNYRRALQGELARTISGLSQVESARVHLSVPEKRLFSDNHDAPRASIVLNLKAGRTLARSEIDGIVHLTASSVDGLSPESVVIVDQRGKLLSSAAEGDSVAASVGSMLEYQRKVEGDLERRVESLLSAALGAGKVIASVTAEMDFTQSETTKEAFDPDGAVVRSEQRSDEKNVGRGESASGGVPGGKTDGAEASRTVTTTPSQGTKATETINYEVSKVVNRTVAPVGVIKRISVAVMVDGVYVASGDEGDGPLQYQPRSEEEMARLAALIRGAVGFDEKRGDAIEVTNVPFDRPG